MFEDSQMPQQLSSPMRQGTSFVPLDIGAQNDSMANITNQGQLQQHYLQVAQQQRHALPGQAQPSLSVGFTAEQYRTFQHRQLDAQLDSAFQGSQMSPQHMAQPAPVFPGLGISGMMPESNAVGMPGFGYLNPMTISSPQRSPLTPPMQSTSTCSPRDLPKHILTYKQISFLEHQRSLPSAESLTSAQYGHLLSFPSRCWMQDENQMPSKLLQVYRSL